MSRTGIEAKPTWRSLPPAVRRRVTEQLGATVERAARVWGGYGPSPTFRLALANGQRAFFKGCAPDATTFLREAFQAERRVYTQLERYIAPWAPRLLGIVDEGGWQALLLEDVGPKTAPPWTPTLARRVMSAYSGFHQSSLGADLPAWVPRFADADALVTWRQVIEETDDLREVAALAGSHASDAMRWLHQAGPLFARLTASAAELPGPNALLHFDTRSDNLRLQDGRLRLFDWPAVEVGPVEVDVVALAQSITIEGGPEPERLLAWYDGELRPDAVDISLAWLIGFFALRAWQPEVPDLPRLRRFQRQQLATLLDWSARRFHMPTPNWTAAQAQ